jgi:Caspase domain/Protein of unknown function (DUF559)
VIGIDGYRRWTRLNNAVSDARGVLDAFEALGFVSIVTPLLDDAATGEAIGLLPASLKPQLDVHDSLVVFFAGHGHTTRTRLADGVEARQGYLIPVDADVGEGRGHTWQRLEHWLSTIAELPPRHILVILDSCHSGIALSRNIQHRCVGVRTDGSPTPFRARRSRLVLTSALDDQRAMDGGPIAGHSVFTGYLIKALRDDTSWWRSELTSVGASDIAGYVRSRVRDYSDSRQVPELGALEYHDSGELVLSRKPDELCAPGEPHEPTPGPDLRRVPSPPTGPQPVSPERARRSAVAISASDEPGRLPDRSEGWLLDPALAAQLDRQSEERRRGAHVLTVVAGDALAAQTSWGTWAARHGYLTLATQSTGLDAVVADLLAQTPWLRCVPEARKRLAAAAGIDVQTVDASLDARSTSERRTWIDDVAGLDPHARVSGWLLSSLRRPTASVPDLDTAPVRHGELLAIACDLASPTAVLLFSPAPDERWLERAIVTAAELIAYLPAHSVAVTAPHELVDRVLGAQRRGAAWTMARQGRVSVDPLARRLPGRAQRSTMRVLFDALSRDPRTHARFELDGEVVTADGSRIDVALVAHRDRIAVELDGWYHFHDPEGYRRDRVQDTRLQRAGYFVLRFPAEDVDDRLASTIEQLAIALASRRAVRALP